MDKMKDSPSFVVIGDVVGSRASDDRAGMHRRLSLRLDEANLRFGSDLRVTVGDEYQGGFPSLGAALQATWWVRLQLAPEIEVRHGIGVGAVQVLAADGIQDGPGWWAARAAIEEVEVEATRARTRNLRDRVHAASGPVAV